MTKVGTLGNNKHVDFKRLFEIAKQNTKYNAQGQAVISKDDPWRYETEWDEYNDEDISLDHPRNH